MRTHLYFADEEHMNSIQQLLNKFFDFDNDRVLSFKRILCSYVQMLCFYSNNERINEDEEEEPDDVLIPKKSGLNFWAEINSLQKIIFEGLA